MSTSVLSVGSGLPAHRRRFRAARWSAVAVGLAAVVLIAVLATRQPANMAIADSPLVGKVAPAIVAKSFNGASVSLAAMRGRWVLVNFFASWCDACQVEEPQLEQFLYSHPGGAETEVLGVLYGDTESDGKSFQLQEGATWPSVVDPGGRIASSYGVASLPHSFIVDPAGRVAGSIVGAVTVTSLDRWITEEQSKGA